MSSNKKKVIKKTKKKTLYLAKGSAGVSVVVCLLGVRGGRGLSAGANVGRPFQQSGVLRDGPHALLHALHDVFQPHDKYL